MNTVSCFHELLKEILTSHKRAHALIRDGMYAEGYDKLCEILEVRTSHLPFCREILIVDIAATNVEIGNVLQMMSLYGNAANHFHRAWVHYSSTLGASHALTREIELKWVQAIDHDCKFAVCQRQCASAA